MIKACMLAKFKDLLKRKYIFHLHTNYTDGTSSVEDYCLWASKNRYDAIVFTEHVRKKLSYNFEDFLSDIGAARLNFPELDVLVGVEAKVLPKGILDMPKAILSDTDVICFACHSFPNNISMYEKALKKVFSDARWKKYFRVWVHPGFFLKRLGLLDDHLHLLEDMISFAVEEGVFIENNIKYGLPPVQINKNKFSANLITGLDAHSVESMEKLMSLLK